MILNDAFEGKEAEWILNDLGLDSSSQKYFKLEITKVGLVEKRELNEEFYSQLFPGSEVKDEDGFNNKLRDQLQSQWDAESRNQLHHQLYHQLLETTLISLPDSFLKNWMKSQGKEGQQKSEDEVEKEFPNFINQLKWSLITEKLILENDIQVQQEEIRQFAKQQLFGYMGGTALDEDQQWVRDYIDKMMKDRKYVEESYSRIQTQKMFEWIEGNLNPVPTPISKDEFIRMNETHKHEHHED